MYDIKKRAYFTTLGELRMLLKDYPDEMPVCATPNSIYSFYDHGVLRFNGEADAIEKAIMEHDHDTFMKYYRKYEGNGMLPRFASCFFENTMIFDVDMTDECAFNLVSESEYEWG